MSELKSIKPANGEILAVYTEHTDQEIDAVLQAVEGCQKEWRDIDVIHRSGLLKDLAQGLRDNAEEYARLMTMEMGKPIEQAKSEVEKCAWVAEYYAETAPQFLADIDIESSAKKSCVAFRPLGSVLAIMPWNFPFWQAFRFAVPAIAAGNTVVLKHASNVTGCALSIEELFNKYVGKGVLRTLIVSSDRMNDVIGDDRIQAVTFTGSTSAGARVAEQAGRSLKKSVLELGGSDPYVVLEDADVEKAAATCAAARLVNTGQSCIAAKRFIVHENVYENFTESLCREMGSFKMGDPMQQDTDLGPMAREDLAEKLHEQVESSAAMGARRIMGGGRPADGGAYYPPTVMVDVVPGMPAFDEELFGPVAAVIKAKTTAEALELANNSPYGLGGAVFTADEDLGFCLARDLVESGCVAVNGQVQSDPRLPFGGIKHSGYGRELGEFGIREFVNIKSVSLF